MLRGSCVEVTCPAESESTLTVTASKFVWLKALKNSARNWKLARSPNFTFLIAERSQSSIPGPSRFPLLEFPKGPMASEKELVVNHCNCFFTRCTGATLSGRGAMSAASMLRPPKNVFGGLPAAHPVRGAWANGQSKLSFDCLTVSDCPESNCVIPETCQPPRVCPTSPCCSLKKGSS